MTKSIRQLRVAQIFHGNVVRDRTFSSSDSVTLGLADTHTFPVDIQVLPEGFELIRRTSEGTLLRIPAHLEGKAHIAGENYTLNALRTSKLARPASAITHAGADVPVIETLIRPGDWGLLECGESELFFQFVTPPAAVAGAAAFGGAAVVVASGVAALFSFLGLGLLLSAVLQYGFLTYINYNYSVDDTGIDQALLDELIVEEEEPFVPFEMKEKEEEEEEEPEEEEPEEEEPEPEPEPEPEVYVEPEPEPEREREPEPEEEVVEEEPPPAATEYVDFGDTAITLGISSNKGAPKLPSGGEPGGTKGGTAEPGKGNPTKPSKGDGNGDGDGDKPAKKVSTKDMSSRAKPDKKHNSKIKAEYPEEMKSSGEEAEIIAIVYVRADGTVKKVKIVKSGGDLFDAAAEAAFLQFKFEPALDKDGNPVEDKIKMTWRFRLEDA